MADLTGEQLGPFSVQSLIGTGGFATVYRAHDPRLDDTVAIKILAENHALNAETRERFLAEAHALRRVSSPSVVQIYDIRETPDGRPYLVLEYADRGDLAGRRRAFTANGWLPQIPDVQLVVDTLTEALDAIHAEALVHRDVTPSNLLLRSGRRTVQRPGVSLLEPVERFMLSDMGLVKDLTDGSALTVGGGTAGFWAPEQQQHLTNVDHRTDVYAATALVAWLLTGHAVGITPNWRQMVAQLQLSPHVLPALDRGLAQDPAHRPQTITQWREDLTAALNAAPATASAAHVATAAAVAAPEPYVTPAAPVAVAAPQTAAVSAPEPTAALASPSTSTTPSTTIRNVVAGAVFAIALAVAAFFVLRGDSDLNPTAVPQANDEIAVTVTSGVSSLGIVGPENLVVGQPATYVMQSEGIESTVWQAPDGRSWLEDTLVVEASSEGQGTVRLQGTTADGEIIEVDLTFVARDDNG